MAHNATHVVPHRRKREGKTDYRKRLTLLKSRQIRLVIRKTNTQLIAQLVEYVPAGDIIVAQAKSTDLKKMGWEVNNGNIPEAYLVGLLIAKRAEAKNIKKAIVDTGLHTHIVGSKIYAVVKGCVDGGIEIPVSEEAFPDEKRINGQHISEYATALKSENNERYQMQFGRYIKAKVDPATLHTIVATVKKKIAGMNK